MPTSDQQEFVLGSLRLDWRRRSLTLDGLPKSLGGRAFDVLGALAMAGGQTMSKNALLEQAWPGLTVDENNLQVQISALRKALGEGWIITIPGRGYRLSMPVINPAASPSKEQDFSGKPSIAVLPFANMSGNIEQDYFADGVADDIITELSRNHSLLVIARNSSFTYRSLPGDVKRIGGELGVRYVLEGSVRRASDRIRVTAQLIEAESGNHIWAERYDRDQESVFSVQDEITQAVVIAVGPAVADAERQRAIQRPPRSLDAWDLYQRGMWHLTGADATGNEEAHRLFERAIALDPMFARAYTGLARTCGLAGAQYVTLPMEEAIRVASMHVRKAIRLDPGDADAHAELSQNFYWQGDLPNSLVSAAQALSLNPNCALAHMRVGAALIYTSRMAEGRAAISALERLSPHDPDIVMARHFVALSYYFDHDYEQCVTVLRRQVSTYPNFPLSFVLLARALGQLDRIEEARAALETAQAKSGIQFNPAKRPPWCRHEDHKHLMEGLRKAGWRGSST